jgi:hypothetical protein
MKQRDQSTPAFTVAESLALKLAMTLTRLIYAFRQKLENHSGRILFNSFILCVYLSDKNF